MPISRGKWGSRLAFIKNCPAGFSKLTLSIFSTYVIPSLHSGGIVPERSGVKKNYNVSTNLSDSYSYLSFSVI